MCWKNLESSVATMASTRTSGSSSYVTLSRISLPSLANSSPLISYRTVGSLLSSFSASNLGFADIAIYIINIIPNNIINIPIDRIIIKVVLTIFFCLGLFLTLSTNLARPTIISIPTPIKTVISSPRIKYPTIIKIINIAVNIKNRLLFFFNFLFVFVFLVLLLAIIFYLQNFIYYF